MHWVEQKKLTALMHCSYSAAIKSQIAVIHKIYSTLILVTVTISKKETVIKHIEVASKYNTGYAF
jgi:hypothetical protein